MLVSTISALTGILRWLSSASLIDCFQSNKICPKLQGNHKTKLYKTGRTVAWMSQHVVRFVSIWVPRMRMKGTVTAPLFGFCFMGFLAQWQIGGGCQLAATYSCSEGQKATLACMCCLSPLLWPWRESILFAGVLWLWCWSASSVWGAQPQVISWLTEHRVKGLHPVSVRT